MKKFLKNQKGFVGADIIIGLSILILFIVLLTTVYVNTNNSAMAIQRNAKATEIITNIFEKIDLMYYDELLSLETEIDLKSEENEEYKNIIEGLNIPNGYKIFMKVEPYKSEEEQTIDLIKKVIITVKYSVGRKEDEITMHKLKARENIIVPNKPKVDEENFPIKKDENGNWIKTTENDKSWYNYKNNTWAYIARTEDTTVTMPDGKVSFKNGKEPLVWIPAYGKNDQNEYKYLYSNTGKATKLDNKSGAIITVISDENITVPEEFKNSTGIWKSIKDFTKISNGKSYESILRECK